VKRSNEYGWNRWFAWYPIRLYACGRMGRLVWLRWIEYRHCGAVAPNGDLTDYWEYRAL